MFATPAANSAAALRSSSPQAAVKLNRAVANTIHKTNQPFLGLPKQQVRDILS
jgi:hypothetical protein